jgi:outer membrane protein assembly factor BamB
MRYLSTAALIVTIIAAFGAYGDSYVVWPDEPFIIPAHPEATNAAPANPRSPEDVLTQRYNNQRTGTTVSSVLNQDTVVPGRFGFLGQLPVEGAVLGAVLSQPLFMAHSNFTGGRSVVFVATAQNKVYAFDAESFELLWQQTTDLGLPDTNTNRCGIANGSHTEGDQNNWMLGIESTPVIDPATGRLFVSYRHGDGLLGDGPSVRQKIAALRIADGTVALDKDGVALNKVVEPDDDGWHQRHRSRASLLLVNGVIFVAFAAQCEDAKLYNGLPNSQTLQVHGRVVAFDAGTLERIGDYAVTPDNVDGGGIWQGSTGLASDGKGNLFFATGDKKHVGIDDVAPADPDGTDLSDSVVRLKVTRLPSRSSPIPRARLTAADWFTPYRKTWLDMEDMDLAAGGVVLIPGTPYLVAGGKEGIAYLVNQTHMGRFDASPEFKVSSVINLSDDSAPDDPLRDHVHQKLVVGTNQYLPKAQILMKEWMSWPHIHGTPVFGVLGKANAFLYVWPEKDHLQSFRWLGDHFQTQGTVATGLLTPQPLAPPLRDEMLAPDVFKFPGATGMPGGMLSLALDPSRPGKGVLFASVKRCRTVGEDSAQPFQECLVAQSADASGDQDYGMLRAFDPMTMAELWNDQLNPPLNPQVDEHDRNYWYAKWVPPTIAGDRVFLATWSGKVLVFGKLGQ